MQQLLPKKQPIKVNYKKKFIRTNHFDFSVDSITFYRFSIDVTADENKESQTVIDSILEKKARQLKEELGDFYCTGELVYAFKPLKDQKDEFKLEHNGSFLTLKPFGRKLKLSEFKTSLIGDKEEIIKFLSVFVKKWISNLGFFEYGQGGRYYRYDAKFGEVNDSLKVLEGYKISFDLYEDSTPKILIDYCTRVISKINLWQDYNNELDRGRNHLKAKINTMKGRTFLKLCGQKKLVNVSDFDLEKTAMSPHPHPDYRNYKEFYEKQYGVKVKDPDQYLAYSFGKRQVISVGGKKVTERKREYYLPEFLAGTGMNDRQRSNFRTMNQVAEFTRLNPEQRINKITWLGQQFSKVSFNSLGLKPDLRSNNAEGCVMPFPKIFTKKNQSQLTSIVPTKGNFFLKDKALEFAKLKKWTCIWEEDYDFCDDMVSLLRNSAHKIGFELPEPTYVEMDHQCRPSDYKKEIRNAKKGGSQLILFLLKPKTLDRGYDLLKKICNTEVGIISQMVRITPKYLSNKMRRGIGDKIALQQYSKLGYSPWKVEKPKDANKVLDGMMMIGADVFHSRGKESIASVVGTIDKDFTKYNSVYRVQARRGQEIMNDISEMVIECVEAYKAQNKKLPKRILFYRDGVGEGQIQAVKEVEIAKILEKMEAKFGASKPKLSFVLVTKRINDRLFEEYKQKAQNPRNGLIVHSKVVKSDWEFLMVAQNVNMGTATPTKYQVLYDESKICSDMLFQLTYFQCYNYYNWSGPVKVPAVCQYAHKQAYFIGQSYKCANKRGFESFLYYL